MWRAKVHQPPECGAFTGHLFRFAAMFIFTSNSVIYAATPHPLASQYRPPTTDVAA